MSEPRVTASPAPGDFSSVAWPCVRACGEQCGSGLAGRRPRAGQMADSTAMTVDFLRARLLSERSVSRAAKERADELAKRVAELEEQVRAVTAQRRQAERAAADVLAVLESQGFGGHLSDVDDDSDVSGQDSGEVDDGKRRGDTAGATVEEGEREPSAAKGEAEDALSGTAQPGGLSWKGRSVSPRKARQLKQRHRRSFFYLLSSSDSSPKYRVGQSCRKNKRRVELSNASRPMATEDDGGGGGSQKGRQDGSDFTDDGQADMDGEVGGDERSSGGGGGGGQYVIRYEEDGEMERVLERQAELIGQYEEEEKAQREWEKQYNENRNANKGDVELKSKAYQTDAGAKSNVKNLSSTNNTSADRLQKGSLSESPQNGAQRREANEEPDHGCAQTSSISAPESSSNSTVTRQEDQHRGDQISDGDSGYSTNARSPKHDDAVIRAPSDGSPSSDTLNSKVTDWSSSQFHDCTDGQLDTQSSYPPASCSIADIESVLQALQRARISLSAKLSKPVPPSQVTLALPAPGDEHREYDDLPANDDDDDSYGYGEKLSGSSPGLQEMLALPAPEDYHERDREDSQLDAAAISHVEKASSSSPHREEMLALPAPGDDYRKEIEDYMKIPVGSPGLFRLPIDSFPVDEKMFSGTACGSRFSLGAAASHATSIFSNPAVSCGAATATSVPSISSDGSGFPSRQGIDLQASGLLSVPASGRCISMPTPDFAVGTGSAPFLSGIPVLQDLNRGMPLADADLFMQRGIECTISNKWML
ncbi:uncharacterized protein LOC8060122 [Sorghum bicolor]|uniref:uncharacterized protein LOC8060122 n=1 Tax=Sorghum bicolor TaxID=4558 RepID=UPI00081AC698|nr:uncharacterized protein LOC8060122 [Sorghum bicolor]|eukprot:XP_021313374.1 uncharacterized protein LOC8060122 [Sorghum bicolor]